MPNPVTNLTATFPAGDERIRLDWTNPATLDGIRISMRLSGTSTWLAQYLNVPVSLRYLYPVPGFAYDFMVETTYQGVYSTGVVLSNLTVPWYCDTWGLVLTDVGTGISVNLGLVSNYDSLKRVRKSKVTSFTPMGATFPKDFPSRAKYRTWPNLQFTVYATEVRTDGTIIDNATAVVAPLEGLFPPDMGLLLWRDSTGLSTYVKIVPDPDITPLDGGGWVISLNVEERKPPAFPLTAAA